jgi:hypothetical protein
MLVRSDSHSPYLCSGFGVPTLPAGNIPSGVSMSRSVAIVLAYAPDVCGIEFPAPWHVVSLRREDIVLSEDEGNDAIQKVRANGDRCRRRDGYRLQNGSGLVAVNCLLQLTSFCGGRCRAV